MHARPARPRRTKSVTLKLTQAEFAALERTAGTTDDLGPFCRKIVTNHLNVPVDSIQWLQLKQQAATHELIKRLMLLIPGVKPSKVEEVESKVKCIEGALASRLILEFERDLQDKQRERVKTALNCTLATSGNEGESSDGKQSEIKNQAKCDAIMKRLVELAKANPQKIVGLGHIGNREGLHVGSNYIEIPLPDDKSYRTWCFFVDDLFKAVHGDPDFNWNLPEPRC